MLTWVLAAIGGVVLSIAYYAWYQRGDLVASVTLHVRDQIFAKASVDVRRRVGADWHNPEIELQVRTPLQVATLVLDPANARFVAEALELAVTLVRGED